MYFQNSALLPFLQFYSEFTERKNFDNCKLLLNEFKECIFQVWNKETIVQPSSIMQSVAGVTQDPVIASSNTSSNT